MRITILYENHMKRKWCITYGHDDKIISREQWERLSFDGNQILTSSFREQGRIYHLIQRPIQENTSKFQSECLWQLPSPTLTGCKIVPCNNFTDQRLYRLLSQYCICQQQHQYLRAFNSTQKLTAELMKETTRSKVVQKWADEKIRHSWYS